MTETTIQAKANDKKQLLYVVGGITAIPMVAAPAHATVADVNTMVDSLSGVAAGITTIVLGAMGVRYAIKIVNRVAVKG